jgi:glutamyl/glutaminyl-tRNA synthetase
MHWNEHADAQPTRSAIGSFAAHDIARILCDRGWLVPDAASGRDLTLDEWLNRAADLLGPHATRVADLAMLLEPIFAYDAAAALRDPANQDVLTRTGAREVIRELANRILESRDIDSDRFKQIVESMKEALPYRSRAMFHPLRVALTGRVGEGELDRVVLLVDSAAKLKFAVSVKTTRQRMLEFCSALD